MILNNTSMQTLGYSKNISRRTKSHHKLHLTRNYFLLFLGTLTESSNDSLLAFGVTTPLSEFFNYMCADTAI